MKKNKKGFTLIELLAVIVVLAIIILIATTQVNKTIKQAKIDANDTNKTAIKNAAKDCLLEYEAEECSDLDYLQENGYLTDIKDPWGKDNEDNYNLNNSYAIIIPEKGNPKVIYYGEGVEDENETPPDNYFSYCSNDKTCVDGLTEEGKTWLIEHDDILIFPENVETIKNCQKTSTNCTNFKGINIEALIATSNVTIDANFSGTKDNPTTINVLRIDGGNIGDSKFQYTNIKRLIFGNASDVIINDRAFKYSKINSFEIINGMIGWEGIIDSEINKLVIGEGVTAIHGNAFSLSKIKELVIKSNDLKVDTNGNSPFRNTVCEVDSAESECGTNLVISSNVDKLPKKLFGNTNMNTWGGRPQVFKIKKITIEGNNRFSKNNLFNSGLWCTDIPEDIGIIDGKINESLYYVDINASDYTDGQLSDLKKCANEYEWFRINE